ncbi:MAG TPA: PAS domain-containing protein [Burkholderiales bacterium]|nr:PAS domain-containing protein [Burkholderiales bacterium]
MPWRDLSAAQLLDRMPVPVFVTRPNGRIEYANLEARTLVGVKKAAVAGRDIVEFRWGAKFARILAAATRKGTFSQWQDEARYRGAGGREVWVLETVVPVEEDSGKVGCFLHFLQPLAGG